MLVEDIREGVLVSIKSMYFTIYSGRKKKSIAGWFHKLNDIIIVSFCINVCGPRAYPSAFSDEYGL